MARRLTWFGLLVALLAAAMPAFAQSQYCESLRAELAGLDRGSSSSVNQEALRSAQAELRRTQDYYQQVGCDSATRKLFNIFSDTPKQCTDLQRQIREYQNSISFLRAEATRNTNPATEERRVNLQAAVDANCRPGGSRNTQANRNGLMDLLFGGGKGQLSDNEMSDEPPMAQFPGDDKGYGYRTICVRSCDGFYFPISSVASRARFGLDADLCRASCPNAEVSLYVVAVGQDPETATTVDGGATYGQLPNAYKYRQSKPDPSCACRKQGQSWSEALAEAEKILAVNGRSDAQVSEQRSFEMSRPRNEPTKAKTPAVAVDAPAQTSSNIKPAGERMIEITDTDGTKKKIRLIVPSTTQASE